MQLLLTLFIIVTSLLLLSMGTFLMKKPLKGSCGGNDESCTCSALEKKMCKTLLSSSSETS